jgi:hypothetical protein
LTLPPTAAAPASATTTPWSRFISRYFDAIVPTGRLDLRWATKPLTTYDWLGRRARRFVLWRLFRILFCILGDGGGLAIGGIAISLCLLVILWFGIGHALVIVLDFLPCLGGVLCDRVRHVSGGQTAADVVSQITEGSKRLPEQTDIC